MQKVQTKTQTHSQRSEAFELQNWELYRRSIRFIKTAENLSRLGKTIEIASVSHQLPILKG